MKKLMLLLLVMALLLCGCGGESTPGGSGQNDTAAPQITKAEDYANLAGQNRYREHEHVTDIVVAVPTEGSSILPLLEAQLGELTYYGSYELQDQLVGIVFEGKYTDTLTPNAYVLLADQRQVAADDGSFGSYPYELLYSKDNLEYVDRPAVLLDEEEFTYIPPSTAAGYTKIKLNFVVDGSNIWQSLKQKQDEFTQLADAIPGQYQLNKNGMLDILNDTRVAEPTGWAANPEVLAMCDGNSAMADYVMYSSCAEWLGKLAAAIEAAPAEQWATVIAQQVKQLETDNQVLVLREQQYALADRLHTYKMMAEYDQELFATDIAALEQQYGEEYKYSVEYAAILAQAPDLRALENLQMEIDRYSKQMELLPEYAQQDAKLAELKWQRLLTEQEYEAQLRNSLLKHGEALNNMQQNPTENADILAAFEADIAACAAETARISAERDAALAGIDAAVYNRQLYLSRTADNRLLLPYLNELAQRIGEINTQPTEKTTVLGELDGFTIIKISSTQVKAVDDARFVYGVHNENTYKNMSLDEMGEYVGGECTICKNTACHTFQGYRYCDTHYVEAIAWALNNVAK